MKRNPFVTNGNLYLFVTRLVLLVFVCLSIVSCDLTEWPFNTEPTQPSKTNWEVYATQITRGAKTDSEKVQKIYEYICENIAYDTDYKIYHADECWKMRKGVCQAYSEVFYYLLNAVSIDCKIISGEVHCGPTEFEDHAWNRVFYDGKWHLMDVCWGAGYVSGDVFSKLDDHFVWYDVDPYRMICTHYPDNSKYAYIDMDISKSFFRSLPWCLELFQDYGRFDFKKMLEGLRDGTIEKLPTVGYSHRVKVSLVEMPLNRKLKMGVPYKFRIIVDDITQWEVRSGFDIRSDWTLEADGSYSMIFTPSANFLWLYCNSSDILKYTVVP